MMTDAEVERLEDEGMNPENWKRLLKELLHTRIILKTLRREMT